jgi:phosphatidylglycerol:prolipoprotein diacylglycerol transferase
MNVPLPVAPVRGSRAARVAYAALFALVLPALLALWAWRLDALLSLPAPRSLVLGGLIAAAGIALMAAGTHALWSHGRGLPMSPFPPERLVTRGIYAIVADPLYVGAVMVAVGASLVAGSGGGLWVVSPVLALASIAWVQGYERDATRRRFGAVAAPVVGLSTISRWFTALARVPWRWVRGAAEWTANSWREVTIGPVRFINHGIPAAVGVAVTILVPLWLIGREYLWWTSATIIAAGAGAALWAQLVEGSPQLLRPFGYFGGIFGLVGAAVVAGAAGADAWLLLGAMVVGAAFGQPFGRARCLMQGCCHGREAAPWLGIRYTHPRSRVVRLSTLGGVPVHATPVYSMFWTLAVGCTLLWLWRLAAPLSFIVGVYFVLIGLGRFVEEHYRGEPQTATVAGLRLYQWLALAFVVGGAAAATITSGAAPAPTGREAGVLPAVIVVAFVSYLAFGVDFPRSGWRFSRLT